MRLIAKRHWKGILFEELKVTTLKDPERKSEVLALIKQYSPNLQTQLPHYIGHQHTRRCYQLLVDKENIDMVVMGTRGETNDHPLSFGSTP